MGTIAALHAPITLNGIPAFPASLPRRLSRIRIVNARLPTAAAGLRHPVNANCGYSISIEGRPGGSGKTEYRSPPSLRSKIHFLRLNIGFERNSYPKPVSPKVDKYKPPMISRIPLAGDTSTICTLSSKLNFVISGDGGCVRQLRLTPKYLVLILPDPVFFHPVK